MTHPFLHYYESELRYMRELGAEFSRKFPKVAARLGLSDVASEDPHVERLLQGFAFSAGRVHMALDAEFPELTQPLAELLYRNFLAPTPSMAVVQFSAAGRSSSLGEGFTIPRDTLLEARDGVRSGAGTRCEFRTAHAVRLLPISLETAAYTSVLHDLSALRVPTREPPRALLKLKLRCHNTSFDRLGLQSLPLFLYGRDEHSARLREELISCASTIIMRWGPDSTRHVALASVPRPVKAYGFESEQALLPRVEPAFEPYRLLQEYFACPARFDFVELTGLAEGLSRCASDEIELLVVLSRFDETLEHKVDASRLLLFATPVVNLFTRDCGRGAWHGDKELQVVPDPARPLDFEVHSLTRVSTRTGERDGSLELQPAYMTQGEQYEHARPRYVLRRRANPLPERLVGARSSYHGSEVFLRLSGPGSSSHLRQLEVQALCTNRDLPLSLALRESAPGSRDFDVRSGVPADAVRCIVAPTMPTSAPAEGAIVWCFLSHLSRNYLSLDEQTGGAEALRELLELYAPLGAAPLRRQINGIRTLHARPIVGPLPVPGPHQFVRGLEIRLECEEQAFGGHGAFVLAAVLARLFTKNAATSSFAQTVLATRERGEVYTFPALLGLRQLV